MGRLARHRNPQAVALCRHRAAVGEHGDGDHHRDGERLQHGQRSQIALRRERPVVHRADRLVHDRRVHPVQPGGVGQEARVVERRLERQVGRRGDLAAAVGDDQREPQRPHLLAQPKQRLRLAAGPRIVEPAEHAGIQPAGRGRVGLEVLDDEQAGAEAEAGEQGHEHHREGGREALQPLPRHRGPGGRRRGRAPAPRAPAPSRRPPGCSPGGR